MLLHLHVHLQVSESQEAKAKHGERLKEIKEHWAFLHQARLAKNLPRTLTKVCRHRSRSVARFPGSAPSLTTQAVIFFLLLLVFQVLNSIYGPFAEINKRLREENDRGL